MIKLAILRPKFCYGPEIYALHKYLREFYSLKILCEILDYDEFLKRQNSFDLVYKMMGFSPLIFKFSIYSLYEIDVFKNILNFKLEYIKALSKYTLLYWSLYKASIWFL